VYVQTLTLADEGSSVCSKVKDLFLGDFPDGFVDGFHGIGNIGDILNRTVMGNDHILHVVVPKAEIDQFAEKRGTDNHEFTSENSATINVTIQRKH